MQHGITVSTNQPLKDGSQFSFSTSGWFWYPRPGRFVSWPNASRVASRCFAGDASASNRGQWTSAASTLDKIEKQGWQHIQSLSSPNCLIAQEFLLTHHLKINASHSPRFRTWPRSRNKKCENYRKRMYQSTNVVHCTINLNVGSNVAT